MPLARSSSRIRSAVVKSLARFASLHWSSCSLISGESFGSLRGRSSPAPSPPAPSAPSAARFFTSLKHLRAFRVAQLCSELCKDAAFVGLLFVRSERILGKRTGKGPVRQRTVRQRTKGPGFVFRLLLRFVRRPKPDPSNMLSPPLTVHTIVRLATLGTFVFA